MRVICTCAQVRSCIVISLQVQSIFGQACEYTSAYAASSPESGDLHASLCKQTCACMYTVVNA